MDATGQEGILRVLAPLGPREPRLVHFPGAQLQKTPGRQPQAGRDEAREDFAMVISAAASLGTVARNPCDYAPRHAVAPRAAADRVRERRPVATKAAQLEPQHEGPGHRFVQEPRRQPGEGRRWVERRTHRQRVETRRAEGVAERAAGSATQGAGEIEHDPTLRAGYDRNA